MHETLCRPDATPDCEIGYHHTGIFPANFSYLPRLIWMACAPREFRLISRYTREEMGRVWSEEGKFRRWLEVELAATETLAESGVVPAAAAAKIREKARIDAGVVRRIAELEAKVKHDVIAFTMAVGETIGDPDAARWLHYGLTSNDVVDTAQALQLREASRLIEHGLVRFGEVLERRAREFQHTPQIGRTHGVHAEPITFGLKVANWFAENRRNLERFRARRAANGRGKNLRRRGQRVASGTGSGSRHLQTAGPGCGSGGVAR